MNIAMDSGDASQLLLSFGELREYAQQVLTAEEANTAQLLQRFPFPEFD